MAGSVADSQAVNRYMYCGASPIGRVDPSGHGQNIDDDYSGPGIWKQICGMVVGVIIAIAFAALLPEVAAFTGVWYAILVVGAALGTFVTDVVLDSLHTMREEAKRGNVPERANPPGYSGGYYS